MTRAVTSGHWVSLCIFCKYCVPLRLKCTQGFAVTRGYGRCNVFQNGGGDFPSKNLIKVFYNKIDVKY